MKLKNLSSKKVHSQQLEFMQVTRYITIKHTVAAGTVYEDSLCSTVPSKVNCLREIDCLEEMTDLHMHF